MKSSVQVFGKYLLLERLNAGGMAEVFLAKSQGASGITKLVAMKRILPQFSKDANYIDMFKTEAKVVMNLNHSNIVQIYEFGIEQEQFFLVMEYVEGQNLRQSLNQLKKIGKQFSIDQIVFLTKESASGLDHAHRCIDSSTGKLLNIIHRDISPQNIMISFEGEVKIVDFGIAKSETQSEETRAGTIKGKYAYMSPEQADGMECDPRTDVFSLGIVLWELLAQERLFADPNEHAILKKVRECIIPSLRKINPSIPIELERIVNTALMKDRNFRYQSAEDFAKDLNRFLNTAYPDFSKQDFSKFMKSINKEAYLENRKKMTEYAKIDRSSIPSEPIQDDGKTTVDLGARGPALKAALVNEPKHEDANQELPENLSINVENSRIDFKNLNTTGSNTNTRKSSGLTGISTIQARGSLGSQRIPGGMNKPGGARGPISNPQNKVSFKVAEEKSPSSMPAMIALVLMLAGGFWYITKYSPTTVTAIYELLGRQPEGTLEVASKGPAVKKNLTSVPTQQSTIKIDTVPVGAEVFINDKPAGLSPVITNLPMGVPFKLRVTKEGFTPAEFLNENPTTIAFSKSITLEAESNMGLVTIEGPAASLTSANWYVYKNGQLVSKNLPFTTRINAGVATNIKVVDPYTKTEAVETVSVGKNEKKVITLKPNKPTIIK